jgi:hypothetical protein
VLGEGGLARAPGSLLFQRSPPFGVSLGRDAGAPTGPSPGLGTPPICLRLSRDGV